SAATTAATATSPRPATRSSHQGAPVNASIPFSGSGWCQVYACQQRVVVRSVDDQSAVVRLLVETANDYARQRAAGIACEHPVEQQARPSVVGVAPRRPGRRNPGTEPCAGELSECRFGHSAGQVEVGAYELWL